MSPTDMDNANDAKKVRPARISVTLLCYTGTCVWRDRVEAGRRTSDMCSNVTNVVNHWPQCHTDVTTANAKM